ncbi:uncharacterized protein G2W53_037333 [Senna tora]|uniref:Uncharacterized protein n=1 Tax=Senna tora TaxID=362788 RepID=A0A834W6X4_9FABA|nr:uncharacterized protein G2W53_037331 [Senna tora]KAF7810590.1 uncharacterized protein G2W53_037333 [Senna tora]
MQTMKRGSAEIRGIRDEVADLQTIIHPLTIEKALLAE